MSPDELYGLPEVLGRYTLVELLGRGGMGRVVRAHDPLLRRDVALKLVEPSGISAADLPELRFMFHREARATAALRHPNIVEVLDYSGPDAEILFIACELIEGPTLRAVLDERGALGAPVVGALGYELAQALAHAHGRGIVHRDLKPENVFWTHEGRVVLSDFGIAKALGGSSVLGGTVRFGTTNLYGSPAYMSPEQVSGEELTTRSDVFAFGALLFEAASGFAALDGDDVETILERAARAEHAPLPADLRVPAGLRHLIEAALQREVSRRPDAVALVHRLRDVLDGLDVSDPRLVLRELGAMPHAVRRRAEVKTARLDQPTALMAPPANELAPQAAAEPARRANLGSPAVTSPRRSRSSGTGIAPAKVLLSATLFGAAALGASLALLPDTPPPPRVVEVAPPPAPVRVHIRVTTRGELRVDGQSAGVIEGELVVSLSPGAHTLELSAEGHTSSRQVLVISGTAPRFEL